MKQVKQLAVAALNGLDLLPLASMDCGIDRIGKTNGIRFEEEFDDLDIYRISALELDDAGTATPLVFALHAYRGAPGGAVDVLLPAELLGSPRLREIATDIAWALGSPVHRITWPEGGTRLAKGDRDERRRVS